MIQELAGIPVILEQFEKDAGGLYDQFARQNPSQKPYKLAFFGIFLSGEKEAFDYLIKKYSNN